MLNRINITALILIMIPMLFLVSCKEEPATSKPNNMKQTSEIEEPVIPVESDLEQESDNLKTPITEESIEPDVEPAVIMSDPGIRITESTKDFKDFTIDNIMHFSDDLAELHFHMYVPESYDGSKPYALYIALPGHGSYIYESEDIGENVSDENFAANSRKYNDKMIVAALQLTDIEPHYENIMDEFAVHTDQVIRFTEYMFSNYNIDRDKVYISGYSRGGRVMSLVIAKRPELYSAALSISSKWEGDISVITKNRLPIYFVIGRDDESFGSEATQQIYDEIVSVYEKEGLSKDEI